MRRTEPERRALEVVGIVSTLVQALQMIEQGYIFRGSERLPLDAEGMRIIAREALRFDTGRPGGLDAPPT